MRRAMWPNSLMRRLAPITPWDLGQCHGPRTDRWDKYGRLCLFRVSIRTFRPVWPSPLPGSRSEVEGVALPGPELPDLVSDTQFHRPVQAVDLGADPQTVVLEGDLDQQPSEAHGQGQTAQMVHGLGVGVE